MVLFSFAVYHMLLFFILLH